MHDVSLTMVMNDWLKHTVNDWEWEWETIFTCLYPYTVQTRLSRDQRPTKPVSRLGTGRGVGGNLSAIEILNTVEKHEWIIKKQKTKPK